jgi:hypothetical protein
MAIELWEQSQERELDSREEAITEREYGLAAFECALGRALLTFRM